MNPTISVIIPVYNVGNYLNKSLKSVLNQTFTDFEVICVDDGSTDSSLDILNEIANKDSRVKVYHQENAGGGAARNFALTKATGDYIFFMDSDDLIDNTVLSKSLDFIRKNDADFILFKAMTYNDLKDKYSHSNFFSMDSVYEAVGDDVFHYKDIGELIFDISPTPWGKLYTHDLIKRSGAKFAEGCAFHDNIFFWEVLFNSNRICFLNETLYCYLMHSDSIQGSKDKKFLDIFPVVNSIFDMFKKYDNFNYYKKELYNWKIWLYDRRFHQIKDEFKSLFLIEFKNDLNNAIEAEGEEKLLELLDEDTRSIYEDVLSSDTYTEYMLSREVFKLNRKAKKLKKQNKKLKKKKQELNKSTKEKLLSKIKLNK